MGFPITIIVRHPNEKPAKCSVWLLRHRPDLLFLDYPPKELPDLSSYVRLDPSGPPLTKEDADKGLLLLDGSWRWAEIMTRRFGHVPPRSLVGIRTAYPRASKIYPDPEGGLATVEALYAALRILGRPTEGLLDHYRWGAEFLRLNGFEERPE